MAKAESFDIVSTVNMQEVDNAINQTNKEIRQRFDFKKSVSAVSLEEDSVKIISDDDFKLKNVIDILETKIVQRGVPIRNMEFGKIEEASGGTVRQHIKLKQGIEAETARKMVKDIKGLKIKVQAQIMDDQVRVSGKNRDDLQTVIAFLKEQDYKQELQFINYR
jgi:cyclic-di-GMP-binding protein